MEKPPHRLGPSAFTVDRCPATSPLVYAVGAMPIWLHLAGAERNNGGVSQRQSVSGLSCTPLADLPRGNAQEEEQDGPAQKRVIRNNAPSAGTKSGQMPKAASARRIIVSTVLTIPSQLL